jgi:hypothetical protein
MTTGTFHSKVAGVTASNLNGQSRQNYIRAFCKPGMSASLIREPDNPYDTNAVGVWIKARSLIIFTADVQIGYLKADVAPEIARYMDKGGKVSCQITEVTGGNRGKSSLGVNILLTKG